MKTSKKNSDIFFRGYFLVIVFVVIVFIYSYFFSNRRMEISAEEIIKRVDKIYVLPKDEVPSILNVTDLGSIQDKPFFEKAKVGFKVLVYVRSGKAILYDIENNKVVEVGPAGSILSQE